MNLSLLLSAVYNLIDEIRYGRLKGKASAIEPDADLKALHKDLLDLINLLREMVDVALRVLTKAYPTASMYNTQPIEYSDFVAANKYFMQQYAKIRKTALRLEKRLTEKGFESIRPAAERCLQLVDIDGLIGVEAAGEAHSRLLPIKPEYTTSDWLSDQGVTEEMKKFPFDHPRLNKYVLSMNLYFHEMHIRFLNCKESLLQVAKEKEESEEG